MNENILTELANMKNVFGVLMMNITKWHLIVIMGLLSLSQVKAQDIISFENGYLTFTNANTSLYYTVEYLPSLTATQEWSGSYIQLRDIKSDEYIISVPIGAFYRVVASEAPLFTKILSSNSESVEEGYYNEIALSSVDSDLVAGNIRSGATIFGVQGKTEVVDTTSGDALVGDLKSGKNAWVSGAEILGTMPTRTFSNTVVQAGYYPATNFAVVDADLVAGNIKKGVKIFGVSGTNDPFRLEARYIENINGTVTDQATGLTWAKNANHGMMKWTNAVAYIAGLNSTNYLGRNDWRLPSVNRKDGPDGVTTPAELNTLGRYCAASTQPFTKPDAPFLDVRSAYYWSRTTKDEAGSQSAWRVNMIDGSMNTGFKTSTHYVWPVCGPN